MDIKETCVLKTINPSLRIGLGSVDRTNVVGFTEIVPSKELDDVELVAVADDVLPTRSD